MPPFTPRFRTSTIAFITLIGLFVLGFGVSKYFHNTPPPVLGGDKGIPCTWAVTDHPGVTPRHVRRGYVVPRNARRHENALPSLLREMGGSR